MNRRRFLATGTIGLAACAAGGVPMPAVAGEDGRFPAAVELSIDGRPVRLAFTGSVMRTKYTFRVYAIASYLQEGATAASGEALMALDAVKQLHLIFERDVDGASMASSFRESIGLGHPAPAFATELAALERYFLANPVKRGDQLRLTHLPGVGLAVRHNAQPAFLIRNVAFARATWGAYVGPNNIAAYVKEGLTARLR